MTDLAKLIVRLEAQTAQYQSGMDAANRRLKKFQRDTDTSLKGIGNQFRAFGNTVRMAFGVLAGGAVLGKVVRATAEAEAALGRLNNAVKNNAGAAGLTTPELVQMSEELQRLTTYSDDAVQGMQSLLLRFREIGGAEFKRAQKAVLDVASAMGIDLESAAKAVGRSLADPLKGMTALTRMGVVFTAQQRDQIKALIASGETVKAQGIILKSLEDRFGGAAEAARDTFGGALAGLKNDLNNLMEAKAGLPGATAGLNRLAAVLQDPAIKNAADTLFSGLIKSMAWMMENTGKVVAGLMMIAGMKTGQPIEDMQRQIDGLDKAIARQKGWGGLWGLAGKDNVKALEKQRAALIRQQEALLGVGHAGLEAAKKMKQALAPAAPIAAPDMEDLDFDLPQRIEAVSAAAISAGEKAQAQLASMLADLQQQVATFGEGEAAVLRYRLAHGDLAETLREAGEAAAPYADQLVALTEQLTQLQQQAEADQERQQQWNAAVEEGRRITEAMRTPLEIYQQEIEKLNEALQLGVISQETYNRAVEQAQDTLEKVKKKGTEFAEQASRNVQDVLAEFLEDPFAKGLDGMVADFGRMLQRMAAQALAAKIAEKIFGSGGVGSGGGWVSSIMSLFGGSRDSGGRGEPGKAYLIGTGAQPEMFVPDTPGRFIPAGQSAEVTVHQSFTIQAPAGTVSRYTQQQIAATAARGLAEANRRNN